jgi:hypothetical protein
VVVVLMQEARNPGIRDTCFGNLRGDFLYYISCRR